MGETYNGLLNMEIDKIVANTNIRATSVEYNITLHTPVSDIKITLPVSNETLRNYNTNVSDYTAITFLMWAGDFVKDVLPYRDILEITVRSYDSVTLKRESNRYRFILINNNDNTYGGYNSSMSKDDLNKIGQFNIVGQCIYREIEVLRTKYTSGIFRSTDVKSVILSEMVESSKTLAVEGKKLDIKVDVVTPNNDYVYNHIIVPDGTRLLGLPDFLQEGDYGVYNGGVRTYLQKYNNNMTLFVFPIFDKERFEKETKRLIIYRTDSPRLSYIENTYLVDGDLVKIIAGAEINNSDTGGTELMDTGDGIVVSNPSLLTKRNVEVVNGKAIASSSNQLSGSKIAERKDGGSNVNYIGNTGNQYKHRTNINLKKSTVYEIPWKHCDPDLIFPGMPVCIKYKDNKLGIAKLYGTVQGIYFVYNYMDKTTNALLYVAVTRPIDNEV